MIDFILRKICSKLVIQGWSHKRNIIKYYRIMHEEAKKEFREDNDATLNDFLLECFNEANKNK